MVQTRKTSIAERYLSRNTKNVKTGSNGTQVTTRRSVNSIEGKWIIGKITHRISGTPT